MTSLSAKDARVIIPSRSLFLLSDNNLKRKQNVKFIGCVAWGWGVVLGPPILKHDCCTTIGNIGEGGGKVAPNPLLPPMGFSVVHRRAPSDPLAKATGVNGPIQGHLPLGPRLATVRADPLDIAQLYAMSMFQFSSLTGRTKGLRGGRA